MTPDLGDPNSFYWTSAVRQAALYSVLAALNGARRIYDQACGVDQRSIGADTCRRAAGWGI
jgi:hypothetical protein